MLREKFARYSTNPFKHFRALSSDWTSSCRLRRMQRKRNANLIEKQQINKLSPRMTRLLQTSKSHPSFRRHNTALDPTFAVTTQPWTPLSLDSVPRGCPASQVPSSTSSVVSSSSYTSMISGASAALLRAVQEHFLCHWTLILQQRILASLAKSF